MTRNGKIARLPRDLRDELNHRLDDGEQAKDLVQWLNTLPEVKQILASDFASRPVSEQNLSDWKLGGYRDWQRRQERAQRIRQLIERSDELGEAMEDSSICDRITAVLAADLAVETETLPEETSDSKERFRTIRQALRQAHWLRQGDHRALRARIERERWQFEKERIEREKAKRAMAEALDFTLGPIRQAQRRPVLVTAYGGDAAAEKTADFILEMERKYSVPPEGIPSFDEPFPFHPIKANQARSS